MRTIASARCRQYAAAAADRERFEPAYLDEMRGIAEGAHCMLDHVEVVNARTELLAQPVGGGGAGRLHRGGDSAGGGFWRRGAARAELGLTGRMCRFPA